MAHLFSWRLSLSRHSAAVSTLAVAITTACHVDRQPDDKPLQVVRFTFPAAVGHEGTVASVEFGGFSSIDFAAA